MVSVLFGTFFRKHLNKSAMRILGLAIIRILSSIFCNVCLRLALLFVLLFVLVDCLVKLFELDKDEADETDGDVLIEFVFVVEILFEILFNKLLFVLLLLLLFIFALATSEATDFNWLDLDLVLCFVKSLLLSLLFWIVVIELFIILVVIGFDVVEELLVTVGNEFNNNGVDNDGGTCWLIAILGLFLIELVDDDEDDEVDEGDNALLFKFEFIRLLTDCMFAFKLDINVWSAGRWICCWLFELIRDAFKLELSKLLFGVINGVERTVCFNEWVFFKLDALLVGIFELLIDVGVVVIRLDG